MIVPTYNEVENVPTLLRRIESVRRDLSLDLLIVDDNSPDGTAQVVKDLQPERPWLHLLSRERPQGLGSAYRAGFAWALDRDYAFAGEMDADLSHDPNDIIDLYKASANGAALALGSRYVHGGGSIGWPLQRRLLSRGANIFARSLLRLPVRDTTGGFRVYTREAIQLLSLGTTECDGYGFQVEAVCMLTRAGLEIREVPIVFRDRQFGKSKMSKKTTFEAARRCLRLAFGPPGPSHFDQRPSPELPRHALTEQTHE